MRTGRSCFVLALACACACGSPPPPATPSPPARLADSDRAASPATLADAGATIAHKPLPSVPLSPRWQPNRSDFADLGDGRRGGVVDGKRVLLEGDRATVLDATPLAGKPRAHHIPAALGGDWLFVGDHTVHVAPKFDATPRLVASDADIMSIGVGRHIVLVRHTNRSVTVHDRRTGAAVSPPVAGTEGIFGLPSGEVLVRTKKGDAFLQKAGSDAFTKVATRVDGIGYDGTAFELTTKHGRDRIGKNGAVAPPSTGSTFASTDNLFALREPWPDLSKAPPTDAIDRMTSPLTRAMNDTTLFEVDGTALVFYDMTASPPGEASRQPDAFAGRQNCFPVRGGVPSFVACNENHATTLFRIDGPAAKPVAERTFPASYSQDFGGPVADAPLALARKCDGTPAVGAFCLRRDDKTWVDIAPPPDPEKLLPTIFSITHVLTSRDGALYAFGWESGPHGTGEGLIIVDGGARRVRRVVRTDFPAWGRDGIRWDQTSAHGGSIRFLLGGERAGILVIDRDGKITAEALGGALSAVGARALHVEDGKIRETLDAGQHWSDVEPPPGGADARRVGCVDGGCTVGAWHRLGWGNGAR